MEYEDLEFENTPPYIIQKASDVCNNLLPSTSRQKYEIAYSNFMDWRMQAKVNSFSESTLLVYFEELSKKVKPSTLWSQYSMLKSTIIIKNCIDISKYVKLRAFLKRKSEKYVPKQSKTLTPEEIQQFLKDATDEKYLLVKAALAIGLTGACRCDELRKLKIDDMEDFNSALLIKLPDTKTKVPRNFTVTGEFYQIYKKYAKLRPCTDETRFFLNYQNGKCTKQPVGINKFGNMAKDIAKFLQLPNPELYTGHCFRRSSATILVNAGADLLTLKRHGGWKSSNVAESYIDNSMANKMKISKSIVESIQPPAPLEPEYNNAMEFQYVSPSTSTSTSANISITENVLKRNDLPKITFQNCSNITVNYNFK